MKTYRLVPRWGSLLVLLGILIGMAGAAAGPVYACSCAMPEAPAIALQHAETVFAGSVDMIDQPLWDIRFTAAFPFVHFGDPLNPPRTTFAVSTVWKGAVPPRMVVGTGQIGAGCGYEFVVGKAYLVYTHATEQGQKTGICDRTKPLDMTQEDLAALGAGHPPRLTEAADAALPWFTLRNVLLGAGLVGIVLVLIRKYTSRRPSTLS